MLQRGIFRRSRSLLAEAFYSLRGERGYRAAFEKLEAEGSEWRQGRDGYRAALEKLEAEASEWRQGRDGYRAAFEKLEAEASEWRQGRDGYRAAFEALTAAASDVRDERDRILKTLGKISKKWRPLPSGLAGRQLCFLHIGKTAGTSVQEALFEALGDAAVFHESLPGFDRVSPAELALNDFVVGHFAYQHVSKMKSSKFLMTFLRDPVDRVISNYHFLRTKSPRATYSEVALQAARCLSFKDFLLCTDPEVRMVTENFQTKVVAHDIRPNHLNQTTNSCLLAAAEQNLQTFNFVGIVEHFEESMRALSDELGVELSVRKLNANPDRPSTEIFAEELDIVRSLNSLDIQLYANARLRFERNLTCGKTLSTDQRGQHQSI